jgi:hypothetical protein
MHVRLQPGGTSNGRADTGRLSPFRTESLGRTDARDRKAEEVAVVCSPLADPVPAATSDAPSRCHAKGRFSLLKGCRCACPTFPAAAANRMWPSTTLCAWIVGSALREAALQPHDRSTER